MIKWRFDCKIEKVKLSTEKETIFAPKACFCICRIVLISKFSKLFSQEMKIFIISGKKYHIQFNNIFICIQNYNFLVIPDY